MNDKKLAQRLKRGDRLALNRVMDAYTGYLSAVVWRALGPAATAEDVEEIVSDTFLALWSRRDSLNPEQGLKSWLAAVARNRVVDRLRAAPPVPLPLEDGVGGTDGSTPEDELERRVFADALRRAVEGLPPPDDQLVLRFYYEEEKLKDIARDLGLSVPAAKSRLCRARRRLKEILIKGGLANGAAE